MRRRQATNVGAGRFSLASVSQRLSGDVIMKLPMATGISTTQQKVWTGVKCSR